VLYSFHVLFLKRYKGHALANANVTAAVVIRVSDRNGIVWPVLVLGVMVIVWRLRGNIIRTVVCWIV